MAHLNSGATAAVEEFAASMGIAAVPDADGAYGFEFEVSGRLNIVAAEEGDRVVVSLSRPILVTDAQGRGRVLALGGYRAESDVLLRPGVARDGRPVLSTDLPARGIDLPALDRTFTLMSAAFAEAGL